MWRYYNEFDSTKSLGVRYRYIKIPQCGLMEHGLKDIAFYVQKHIKFCTVVIISLLGGDEPPPPPPPPPSIFAMTFTFSSQVLKVKYWICYFLRKTVGLPRSQNKYIDWKLCFKCCRPFWPWPWHRSRIIVPIATKRRTNVLNGNVQCQLVN